MRTRLEYATWKGPHILQTYIEKWKELWHENNPCSHSQLRQDLSYEPKWSTVPSDNSWSLGKEAGPTMINWISCLTGYNSQCEVFIKMCAKEKGTVATTRKKMGLKEPQKMVARILLPHHSCTFPLSFSDTSPMCPSCLVFWCLALRGYMGQTDCALWLHLMLQTT